MKASVDFDHGTVTLVCSRCRRKHVKRIAETKTGLRLRCKCSSVLSWQGDLNWVACCARPYQWDRRQLENAGGAVRERSPR